MKPLEGLYMNGDSQVVPEGSYTFAKNGIQQYKKGTVINEPGFDLTNVVIPGTVICTKPYAKGAVIFSVSGPNSYIGKTDGITYTSCLDDTSKTYKLGFDKDYPIQAEVWYNYKGEIVVAWTDAKNEPRIINIDSPNVDALTDVALFPYSELPSLKAALIGGGNLEEGAYWGAIRYIDEDNGITSFIEISNGVYLVPRGTSSWSDPERAIEFSISGIDKNYSYFQIAILRKSNGVVTTVLMDKRPTLLGESLKVLYSGNETTSDIALEEILIQSPLYTSASTITQLNDRIYLGDLTTSPEINFQQYANDIRVKWTSELTKTITESTSSGFNFPIITPNLAIANESSSLSGSMMHQEVYALYIRLRLTKGRKSREFVIPGPAPKPADLIADPDVLATSGISSPKYMVNDTIDPTQIVSSDYQPYTGIFMPVAPIKRYEGPTGVWVNTDETYPNDPAYGALANQKVRHHRMPSMRFVYKNCWLNTYRYGTGVIDKLGIKVENVIIPASLKDEVIGWEILYAERNQSNMTVLGYSDTLFSSTPADVPAGIKTYRSNGGNFKSLTADVKTSFTNSGTARSEIQNLVLDRVQLHCPDLMVNRPALVPTLLSQQLFITQNNGQYYTSSEGLEDGFTASPQYNQSSIPVKTGKDPSFGIIVDYDRYNAITIVNPAGGTAAHRRIVSWTYNPINSIINDDDRRLLEGCALAVLNEELEMPALATAQPFECDPYGSGNGNKSNRSKWPDYMQTYISAIIALPLNVYNSFYSQTCIPTGYTFKANETSGYMFGGDTHTGNFRYIAFGHYGNENNEKTGGIRAYHNYLLESSVNLALRYEDPANESTKFLSTSRDYLMGLDRDVEPNQIGYKKDLNALNEFTSRGVWTPYLVDITVHPNRIVRSRLTQRDVNSWRSYSPLDYYEMGKKHGRIVNLHSRNQRLLINTLYQLYITKDRIQIDGDVLKAVLGDSNLFAFPPAGVQETDLGYAGLQHRDAAIDTPYGYFFPDVQAGKVFFFGENLLDMGGDISNFLYDTMVDGSVTKIATGYDREYERLLMTVHRGTDTYTLSYNMDSKKWVFFHDYAPMFYIPFRDSIYCLDSNKKLYKMNVGPRGSYGGANVQPFFMDLAFNSKGYAILNSLGWMTKVKRADESVDQSKTFTHAMIWNDQQCSGTIALKDYAPVWGIAEMFKSRDVWFFNKFRDTLPKPVASNFISSIFANRQPVYTPNSKWYEQGHFEGQLFNVRVEYDNLVNNEIALHDVDAVITESIR